MLEHERRRLMEEQRQLRAEEEGVRTELVEGVNHLIRTLEGDTPWQASWPKCSAGELTRLMVQAARCNCPLICCFLRLSGAETYSNMADTVTPLHAALHKGHTGLAEHMVKYMDGCLYVPDAQGHLPTHIMPPHILHQLESVSLILYIYSTLFHSLYVFVLEPCPAWYMCSHSLLKISLHHTSTIFPTTLC